MPNDLLPPPNLRAIAKAIRTKDQTALKYLCTETDNSPAALSRVDADHFTLSRDLFKMCQALVRRFPQVDHPDSPADAREAHFLLEHAVRSRQLANREQPAANGLKEGREQDGREPAWMRDLAAIVTASRSYGYAVARTLFSPLLERLTADPSPVLRVVQTPSGEPIFRFSNECRAAFDRLSSTSSHALLLSAVAAAEDSRFAMTRRRDMGEPRMSRLSKDSPTPPARHTVAPATQNPVAPTTPPVLGKADSSPVDPDASAAQAGPQETAQTPSATGKAPRGLEDSLQSVPSDDARLKMRSEMAAWIRQTQLDAGWNPEWPFVPMDLANRSFVAAIKVDPTLTEEQKAKIFAAGRNLGVGVAEPIIGNVMREQEKEAVSSLSEAGGHPVIAHTVRRQNLIRAAHTFYKEFDIHGAASVAALQTKEPATHAALFGTVNCLNAPFFRLTEQEGQTSELRLSPAAVEAVGRQLADSPRDLPARELQCTFRLDAIRETAPGLPKLAKAIAAATDERQAPGPAHAGPEQSEDGPAFGPTP